jgi:hypothetical protein
MEIFGGTMKVIILSLISKGVDLLQGKLVLKP